MTEGEQRITRESIQPSIQQTIAQLQKAGKELYDSFSQDPYAIHPFFDQLFSAITSTLHDSTPDNYDMRGFFYMNTSTGALLQYDGTKDNYAVIDFEARGITTEQTIAANVSLQHHTDITKRGILSRVTEPFKISATRTPGQDTISFNTEQAALYEKSEEEKQLLLLGMLNKINCYVRKFVKV